MSIRNLRLDVHLGVTEEERAELQPVYVTLTYAPVECATDVLADTADYKVIRDALKKAVEGHSACLLETLTAHLIDSVERCNERLHYLRLTVSKPNALSGAEAVECTASVRRVIRKAMQIQKTS